MGSGSRIFKLKQVALVVERLNAQHASVRRLCLDLRAALSGLRVLSWLIGFHALRFLFALYHNARVVDRNAFNEPQRNHNVVALFFTLI